MLRTRAVADVIFAIGADASNWPCVRVGRGSLAAPGFAAEETAPAAGNKADLGTAKRLFNQGQARYSLGEYHEAISQFRAAYQLSFAPGLLFNIANLTA